MREEPKQSEPQSGVDEGNHVPPAEPFVTLTQNVRGGWELSTNLQVGQAKWTICEVAATLLAELKPKG